MKLTVHKLGRIDDAEIDLRPLTVFIGENGTNKTWVAYILHALVRAKARAATKNIRMEATIIEESAAPPELLAPYRQSVARPDDEIGFELEVGNHDEVLEYNLDSATISTILMLDPTATSAAGATIAYRIDDFGSSVAEAQCTVKHSGALVTTFAKLRNGRTTERRSTVLDGSLGAFCAEIGQMLTKIADNAVVLPSERKALASLNVMGGPAPLPIADFVELLKSTAAARDREDHWGLAQLNQILGGNIAYTDDVPSARRLLFRVNDSTALPLHGAHSLVRAVSGLWAFLAKLAQPGDWLIIDELEMNAHPHAQLALTEFIATLVNKGLRVTITTHSPYIVDHLQNLMTAKALPIEKQTAVASEFVLKTETAFIDQKDVAVHLFEATNPANPASPVVVKDVLDRENRLIDWSTFGRVTNQVGSIYSRLLGLED